MENEDSINENSLINSKQVFKIEFMGENIEKKESFREWQNEMKNIYGKDAVLSKCIKDKIYFYVERAEFEKIPFHKISCPLYASRICYYCKRIIYENPKCCISTRLNVLFFRDGLIFTKSENYHLISRVYKIFLIPIFSFMLFIYAFWRCFYFDMNFYNNGLYIENYKEHLKKKKIFYIIIKFLRFAFIIILSIPYIFIDLYFKIFLFIISIFSKCYPMKYYLGLIFVMMVR